MTTALTYAQRALASSIFDLGAIKFGAFKIKRHEKFPDEPLSPIFLNLRTPENPKPGPLTPDVLRMAGMEYDLCLRRASVRYDAVASVPRAGDPFVESLLGVLDLPVPCIRLEKTDDVGDGTRAVTSVADRAKCPPDSTVLVVDDLITGADTKMEAVSVLTNARFVVTDIVVLVDREQGGREELGKEGITLHSVFTLSALLGYCLESGRISQSQRAQVAEYFRYVRGEISAEEYRTFL